MEPDYKFSKAELADFKRFWEGNVGKKYTEKMERTKEQLLEAAMGAADRDGSACYVHIANGVDSIIKDIEALVKATEEEEDKKKTKKVVRSDWAITTPAFLDIN